ncbi:MAG: sulfotransferase [Betaproteobacteria bacterium]
MPDAKAPLVFVLGTGRCGTHTLWKVFESVPNTLSTHEGIGALRSGPPSFVGKRMNLGCMLEFNAYLYHGGREEFMQRTFDLDTQMLALMNGCFAGRAKAIAWCQANGIAYCDANAFGFNFVNYLLARFPHARFIHLVRDGYACVRSWSRRDSSTYPDGLTIAPAISWLLAKPVPLPSDPAHSAWSRFDRVQKISWFWNYVNANIARRLERVPEENKRVIRIEEVTDETLPGLLDFCGLPQQYSREAVAPDDPTSSPAIEWTPENVTKFNELAASTMASFGYPLR